MLKRLVGHLRKYLITKAKVVTMLGKETDQCLKVLGSEDLVARFAQFYDTNSIDIEVALSSILFEWQSKESFDKEQLDKYRMGLIALPIFFKDCAVYMEKKKAEEERQRRNEQKSLPKS